MGDTLPLFWRRGRATSRLQFQGFQPLEASEVVLFIYFLTTPSLTSGKLKGKQHPALLQGVIGLLGGAAGAYPGWGGQSLRMGAVLGGFKGGCARGAPQEFRGRLGLG